MSRSTVKADDDIAFSRCAHTPLPEGYMARHELMTDLAKTHRQKRCSKCHRWAIWVEKQ